MKIDVSKHPDELFDCPELPEGLNPYHFTLEVDGVDAPTAFAIDTDAGIVKYYKTEPGSFSLAYGEDNRPIVCEHKYSKLFIRWDNKKGISGEMTIRGK